jgi:hypothetical protein
VATAEVSSRKDIRSVEATWTSAPRQCVSDPPIRALNTVENWIATTAFWYSRHGHLHLVVFSVETFLG